MFNETSRKDRYREKIRNSCTNANTILWALDLRTAHALFMHSLNAETAKEMSRKELLKLKGVGPEVVKSIRMVKEIAKKNSSR